MAILFLAETQKVKRMKVHSPYRCDYCSNLKGESNHWWLRPPDRHSLTVLRWDAILADSEGYEHICSESCAAKALSKWMTQPSAPSDTSRQCPRPPDSHPVTRLLSGRQRRLTVFPLFGRRFVAQSRPRWRTGVAGRRVLGISVGSNPAAPSNLAMT